MLYMTGFACTRTPVSVKADRMTGLAVGVEDLFDEALGLAQKVSIRAQDHLR